MKKTLSIIVGLMILAPSASVFAADDVTMTSDVHLTVSGYDLVVRSDQYTLDSITVDSASFSVTLSVGRAFGVTSSDRRKFTVDPLTYVTLTNTCNSSESSVVMNTSQGTGSITVTVTPSTTATCNQDSDSGSGAGGGGGGSIASYNYGATPATPATPGVSPATPATPAAPALTNASSVAQAVSPAFNKDLVLGHKNDDVKRLQQLLAQDKDIYPNGLATGFFGPATMKAVKAFQKKHGLPQVGRVGPATRAKLQEVFGASAPKVNSSSEDESTKTQLQSQIEALMKQIQELQKKK